eukprot:XP_027323653.1 collagen alpha-1(II) chain-like [Anas platyrhynchos]
MVPAGRSSLPASGDDPREEAAHRWNIRPQMPRASPKDAAGDAMNHKPVLGAAAPPDLPGRRHRGPPVDPQGVNGDDPPASRGDPREEAIHRYNIGLQISRSRLEDGVAADLLQPLVLSAAVTAVAALTVKQHQERPAVPALRLAVPTWGSPALAPPVWIFWGPPVAPQHPKAAAAAPAARQHQGHPTVPWYLRAAAPPGSRGQSRGQFAHVYIRPKTPATGPEDATGAAMHHKPVLGAAAPPDLPGRRHRGPPVDPQGVNGDDAPASRGRPGQEAAPHYVRPQIPRAGPGDSVGADVLHPPVLRAAAAAAAAAALRAKRHRGPPAIPRCLNAAATAATPGQSGHEAAPVTTSGLKSLQPA